VEPPAALSAHLAACPACRRWRAEDAAAWEALGALAEPAPPPGLAARVAEAVHRPGRGREGFGLTLGLLAATAALAGALVGAWLGSGLLAPPPDEEPAEPPEAAFALVFDAVPRGALDLPAPGALPPGRRP
jgi:anti-sigma factor RsiW